MLLRTSPILAETVSPLGSRRFFSRITRSDPAAVPVRARFEPGSKPSPGGSRQCLLQTKLQGQSDSATYTGETRARVTLLSRSHSRTYVRTHALTLTKARTEEKTHLPSTGRRLLGWVLGGQGNAQGHAQMYCTCLVLLACHCVSYFFSPSTLFTTGLYRGPGRPRLVSVKCQCQSLSMLRFNHQQARPRDSSSGASGVLSSMRDVTRTDRQGRAGQGS